MRTSRLPLPFLLALALTLILGYLIGRIAGAVALQRTPITTQPDTRPAIPVIHLDGTENGAIVGSVQGDVRIIVDENVVGIDNARVRIPLSALQPIHTVIIPPGMQFVASQNGTRYYPVASSQAERLVPQNRVYFRTAAEAEEEGYRP